MPLSAREQRALDLLEKALTAEDPRLARRLGGRAAQPIAPMVLTGLGILGVLLLGFTLVELGDTHRVFWLSLCGAIFAASTPFLVAAWLGRHGLRGGH